MSSQSYDGALASTSIYLCSTPSKVAQNE